VAALDAAALAQSFQTIAASTSVMGSLVTEFGSRIAEMVATKIVIDYM
jgi:hypothetical protein